MGMRRLWRGMETSFNRDGFSWLLITGLTMHEDLGPGLLVAASLHLLF